MHDKNAMPFAIIVAALLISVSVFYLGYSINKTGNARQVAGTNTAQVNAVDPAPIEQEPVQAKEVSVDDDPFLGDENAKVVLVEFSDFECPFCARHSVQTNPQIIDEFVNSGQVKIVYRDTPFHGQTAVEKSNAANCVAEQLGNEGYFALKDEIYRVLNVEQRNILLSEVNDYAINTLGVESGSYTSCVEENKYQEEVLKDLQDSQAYGVRGTPAFYVGVVNENGMVEGEIISGAQPYAIFKSTIEKYL
jgi:protein-disulfide isomerase